MPCLSGCIGAAPGGSQGAGGPAATADAIMQTDAASAATDAADATKPSKKPKACAPDLAVQACFMQCQPAESVAAPGSPQPAKCDDTYSDLQWPGGKPTTPATLAVELGADDVDSGAFVPYSDGQWAPIVQGVQGGIHVWAAIRVAMPAGTPPKLTLQVSGHSLLGCKVVATELAGATTALAYADGSKPGYYTTAKLLVPGVAVAFAKNSEADYCGQWLELSVEVREPKAGAWGRTSRVLRLFALGNLRPIQ